MLGTLSGKQKVLNLVYPFLIKLTNLLGRNIKIIHNKDHVLPHESLYALTVLLNDGRLLPLQTWKGKKLLLVNTASNCGYTGQYKELQQLQQQYSETLVVLGFPANDFKEQEKGTDAEIEQFCQVNYGVTFPLAKKSTVVKGPQQNTVYQWLTQEEKNGWNNHAPSWNFSKYLVNENGVLTHYFDPSISPLQKEVIDAIEKRK